MTHTVLVLDDEIKVTDSLRRSLKGEPYQLYTANSARDALELIYKQEVHVILCDEKMPEVSGTAFLKYLRKTYPSIVSVMLTGNANLGTAMEAINGCNVFRFLRKPSQSTEIAVTLRDALRHYEDTHSGGGLGELVRMQAAYIRNLEDDFPGISDVTVSDGGRILLDGDYPSPQELLEELCQDTTTTKRK